MDTVLTRNFEIVFQIVGDGDTAIRGTFHRQHVAKLVHLFGRDDLGSQVGKFISDLLNGQVEAFKIVEFLLSIKEQTAKGPEFIWASMQGRQSTLVRKGGCYMPGLDLRTENDF